tara:strand:+ start:321 stop:446 length:126 start_codon:yes stop_codon:yes gene_type:complete
MLSIISCSNNGFYQKIQLIKDAKPHAGKHHKKKTPIAVGIA